MLQPEIVKGICFLCAARRMATRERRRRPLRKPREQERHRWDLSLLVDAQQVGKLRRARSRLYRRQYHTSLSEAYFLNMLRDPFDVIPCALLQTQNSRSKYRPIGGLRGKKGIYFESIFPNSLSEVFAGYFLFSDSVD